MPAQCVQGSPTLAPLAAGGEANTKVRKSCGQTTNSGPLGAPMSTSLEPGPECERKWAWSAAHDWRETMVSRKWCSEMEDAWNCQPCCHMPVHYSNRGVGALRPSMLPNWAVPHNHNGRDFELPLAIHPKIRRAPPSQVATRHGSRLRGRDHGHRVSPRSPQSKLILDADLRPKPPIRMGKLESVWATLSGWDLPSIVLCTPASCPVDTRPKHWEEGFATDVVRPLASLLWQQPRNCELPDKTREA